MQRLPAPRPRAAPQPIPRGPGRIIALTIGALVLGCIGVAVAYFFAAGGKVQVDSPVKVSPPASEPLSTKDYEDGAKMVRARLTLILVRPYEKQAFRDKPFPDNLSQAQRDKWVKRIRERDLGYLEIEREPVTKAMRELLKWEGGAGTEMPDSVWQERRDEIFAPCYAAIIEAIERAEGAR